jgi:flagellar hook protein FlgE
LISLFRDRYSAIGKGKQMVSSVYNSTLSALRAFGMKMGVIANNIANVNTDGFKKSRVVIEQGCNNSVRVDIRQIDTPGPYIYELSEGQMTERELSNVNLAEEIPQLIITQRCCGANLKMIKTQCEILGTIIDIKS